MPDITITVTDDEFAAINADRGGLSVDDYVADMFRHQVLAPIVERSRRVERDRFSEQYEALTEREKVEVVDLIRTKLETAGVVAEEIKTR